jgi:hypothetical protein
MPFWSVRCGISSIRYSHHSKGLISFTDDLAKKFQDGPSGEFHAANDCGVPEHWVGGFFTGG